ncbi:Rxt3-domain-containing protein, partial [Saccharata proteae CBS 121410]
HHHHHHHAPHPVHHHHHAPRANNVPAAFPVLTKPTVETNNDEPLNRVKDVPRNHLGSTVYEAQYTPLPSRNTSIDDRYGARLVPKPLPDDTGKEGCTRTIRVPRFYVSDRERDVICLSKNVWGTDIYTNDSDVIGAAIHSGWIRGAWSEDVDVSMLDPRIGEAREADAKEMLTTKPANPVVPPPNMDVHITILILHSLAEYRSRVCYGLKSKGRKKHVGSSFKIEKIQWVDDAGTAHGEERTGKAQRERI